MSRILGLDWGEKRIGLALGDEEQKIALPFDVVENSPGLVGQLRRIIENENIYRFVIGRPIGLNGEPGEKAAAVEDFCEFLKQHFTLPIILEDERLSSKMVDSLFREYGTKYQRDAVAAMVILQGYLDKLSGKRQKN